MPKTPHPHDFLDWCIRNLGERPTPKLFARFCKKQNLSRRQALDLVDSLMSIRGYSQAYGGLDFGGGLGWNRNKIKETLDLALVWNEKEDGPIPMSWSRYFVLWRPPQTDRSPKVYFHHSDAKVAIGEAAARLQQFVAQDYRYALPIMVVEADNDRDALNEIHRKLIWIDGISFG